MHPPLSRLPIGLNRRQRMNLEALGLASEIIRVELVEMRELIASSLSSCEVPEFSYLHRLLLFRSAWSIVDRMYYASRLLKAEREAANCAGPDFPGLVQIASDMRNATDHPDGRNGAIAGAARAFPLFGIISFAYRGQDDCGAHTRSVALVWASTAHHRWTLDLEPLTCDPTEPCGGGQRLHAFDKALDLEAVSACLIALCEEVDRLIQLQFPGASEEAATQFGADQLVVRTTPR